MIKNTDAENKAEPLGRFGHHPHPAVDFCMEVQVLEGVAIDLAHDVDRGIAPPEFHERVLRAIDFRVGGDPDAVAAKGILRVIADKASILRAVACGMR